MTSGGKNIENEHSSKHDFKKIVLNKRGDESSFSEELCKIFSSESYFRHKPIGQELQHGLGGVVEHIVIALDSGELVAAAKCALKFKIPYIVIGGGTGSLFSEIGFSGLVIVNRTSSLIYGPSEGEVIVDSGVTNGRLVNDLATRSLSGLEFLSGVPGSIGGAIATNASLDGKSLVNLVKELVMFVPNDDEGRIITVSGLDFFRAERSSRASSENSPIILRICFRLSHIDTPEILRRMTRIRSLYPTQKYLTQSLGWVFLPSVSSIPNLWVRIKKILMPKNIYLNRHDPDLVFFKPNKNVLPSDIRHAINEILTTGREESPEFAIRLRFLGYWSSDDKNENTTDTESF